MRIVACLFLLPAVLAAQTTATPAVLTLPDAIAIARRQGPAARAAEAEYERAVWSYRGFRSRLRPQLALAGTAPRYDRNLYPVRDSTGNTRFVPVTETESSLDLVMSQSLPVAGASFFVSTALTRLQGSSVLGSRAVNYNYWNSQPFNVGFRGDLLRPRLLVWESREQTLGAEVAERRRMEAREDVAATTVERYFDAWAASVSAANAASNAAVNDTLYTLNKGRYEVGRIGENELLQSELALLRSRAALDAARLEEERARAALRVALDLPPDAPLVLAAPGVLPSVRPDTAVAVQQALRNRSRISELELADVRARRQITTARLNNGFGATVQASMGFNRSANAFDEAYRGLLNRQTATIQLEMPLFQWGAGRADMAEARAERERVEHVTRQARLEIQQEAHFGALQFALSDRMLQIAAKADTVGTKRFEVARQRYIIGRIGVTDLYIAQTEKDAAVEGYVRALRAYWRDWYRLRQLTLWDFAANVPLADAR